MITDKDRLDFLNTLECGFDHEGYGDYYAYSGRSWCKDVREVLDRLIEERGWKPAPTENEIGGVSK